MRFHKCPGSRVCSIVGGSWHRLDQNALAGANLCLRKMQELLRIAHFVVHPGLWIQPALALCLQGPARVLRTTQLGGIMSATPDLLTVARIGAIHRPVDAIGLPEGIHRSGLSRARGSAMTTPSPRRSSAPPSIGRSSRSREAARQRAVRFVQWYNHEHRHSGTATSHRRSVMRDRMAAF